MLPPQRMGQVFLVKTTLPGDWIEAFVGEFKHKALLAGAACAEHQRVTSMYGWEGAVQSSQEWSVQFTVGADALASVLDQLSANHPYEVPQILHWAADSQPPYYEWVGSFVSVSDQPSKN